MLGCDQGVGGFRLEGVGVKEPFERSSLMGGGHAAVASEEFTDPSVDRAFSPVRC